MFSIYIPNICQLPNCIHYFLKGRHRIQVSSNICSHNFFFSYNGVIHTRVSRTTLWASWVLKISILTNLMSRWMFLCNFVIEIHPGKAFLTASSAFLGRQRKIPPTHLELPRQARWAIKWRFGFCHHPDTTSNACVCKGFIITLLVRSTTQPGPVWCWGI